MPRDVIVQSLGSATNVYLNVLLSFLDPVDGVPQRRPAISMKLLTNGVNVFAHRAKDNSMECNQTAGNNHKGANYCSHP